ncbi:MAG: carboxymuconolactone decarboxylase family protein [Desulfofustis sp. PB-SRB1]|jgi:alkylhydroperoxidase/carboxymuconolactone decarboxylase family protein YurZ|nr:carboxymuconolactone decarboxylase family protein [Desulfofustis sp. PB-SRB1]MBM1002037.1 carboxymuconolactone decarboxylase family protein [Desulfofustis sp. PB-SRB1]HBH29762.1 carboxymuconolactone decarboxylase family protein [Desulfofustis sp.]HBH31615.1 carboxymuconolactone decarboxylase family protein [Desulfofustis sp.]
MELDHKAKFMIILGAARAVKCGPCLEQALVWAVENGLTSEEIGQALAVGKMVRDGSNQMLTSQAEEQLSETLQTLGVHLPEVEELSCEP